MSVKTFVVKGTYYYQAAAEVSAKRAVQGAVVSFQRDPSNRYDSNAVRVLLSENGAHLGHVPRVMSALVSKQILAGLVRKAYIRSVAESSTYVEIKVTYEFEDLPQKALKSASQPAPESSLVFSKPSPTRRATERAPEPALRQSLPLKSSRTEESGHASANSNILKAPGGIRWGRVLLVLGGLLALMLVMYS